MGDAANQDSNPFEGFQATKAVDGVPVETAAKTPEEPKTSVPPVSDEEDDNNPLSAFSDQGDDDDDFQEPPQGGDGDGEGDESSGEADDSSEGDDLSDEDGDGEESGDDPVEARAKELAKHMATERIAELTKHRREAERRASELEARIAKLETGDKDDAGTPPANAPEGDRGNAPEFEVKDPVTGKALSEPDPAKYKYGEVDTQYLRDVVNYQTAYAQSKVQHDAEQARQSQAAEQRVQQLRESWEKVQDDGLSRYDDFEETVLAAGDRGDFDLTQSTFEMAAESEFGADILYHLATNPKTASKVAKMNDRDQARYLGRLEAAIETSRKSGDKGKQKRKAPSAAPPPNRRAPRGKGGKFVNPARSGNFADFEAAVNRQESKR